jgi:hypothetical protein
MRIRMKDGRVFQGTELQIVRAMQDIAFGVEDFTVLEYINWVAQKARDFEGVDLAISGTSDDERAGALVREMLRAGLAHRG